LHESAAAALATDERYYISGLLDHLDPYAASDVGPAGKESGGEDWGSNDKTSGQYFALQDVVLQNIGDEVRCVLSELVISDKSIIVWRENLMKGVLNLRDRQQASQECTNCCTARRQLCYDIGILLQK
jgi:hypothetical protein